YHRADARRRHHHAADPAVDPARTARAARNPRPARAHPGRAVPEAALRSDGEGAVPPAADGEGLEGGNRAHESRAGERDAKARATRQAVDRSPAGAEGDVPPDAPGARGAARDAGGTGRPRARPDEPPDAAPAGKAAQAALASRTRAGPRRWARRRRPGRS